MKCEIISIIPIELFSKSYLLEIRQFISKFENELDDDFKSVYSDFSGRRTSGTYQINLENNAKCYIITYSTSVCIALVEEILEDNYSDCAKTIVERRYHNHKQIVESKTSYPVLNQILSETNKISHKSAVEYIFSFSTFFDDHFDVTNLKYIKVVSEPSLVNCDDMLSSKTLLNNLDLISDDINNINDSDISNLNSTFVTWSSVASLTQSSFEDYNVHKLSLISIELELQNIWNKCYCYNNRIDQLLDGKVNKGVEDLMIASHRVLVDCSSIISSTLSGRLLSIYNKMLSTSEVENQINKLREKIQFLKDYVTLENQRSSIKNQKIFEVLLLVVAIPPVLEIFFKLPLIKNTTVGIISIIALISLGIFLIVRKNSS